MIILLNREKICNKLKTFPSIGSSKESVKSTKKIIFTTKQVNIVLKSKFMKCQVLCHRDHAPRNKMYHLTQQKTRYENNV